MFLVYIKDTPERLKECNNFGYVGDFKILARSEQEIEAYMKTIELVRRKPNISECLKIQPAKPQV